MYLRYVSKVTMNVLFCEPEINYAVSLSVYYVKVAFKKKVRLFNIPYHYMAGDNKS